MDNKLFIFLDIDCERNWAKDVFGKQLEFTLNKRKYTIHTPRIADDYSDCPHLCPPKIAEKIIYEDGTKVCYGQTRSYPEGNGVVSKVVITTETKTKSAATRLARRIDKNISRVVKDFFNYLIVISGEVQVGALEENKLFAHYMFICDNNQNKHVDPSSVYNFQAIFSTNINTNIQDIKTSLRMLSESKPFLLEYEYYVSAIFSIEKHDYRKCVLDAATASEICITSEIKKIIKDKASFIDEDKFLNGIKGLYRKFELLKTIGGNTKGINIENISKSRNSAIHTGKNMNYSVAKLALDETRKILLRFSKSW